VIELRNVSLQVGGDPLLEQASLRLHAGWHVGIIGANGCGKSSLFRLLLGQLSADAGEVSVPGDARIGHMAQENPGAATPAIEHVLGGHTELARVRSAMERAEHAGDDERLARLHGEMDALDGYTARSRAEQLLAGLGFSEATFDRPLAEFSGGWRIRLDLARTLMRPTDILLLDEPTNHLDLDAVLWLEQWLAQYPGTLLLISHDRDFLDAVVGHIVHFDHRRLVHYRGHYSSFERQRAERLAQQQAAYEKQQQRVREIEQFVARFRAKASKARQAQSRLKELERMEEIAPAHVDSPFRFRFPDAEKTSHPLVVFRAVSAGYEAPVLQGVDFSILPGARIGLLGPNGAGKSTLIRTLVGELRPLAGECTRGEHLRIGYFAQHQVDALDADASALAHLQRESPQVREQTLRDFIGGFGFSGDDALRPVRSCSGGEKARLALALIAWRRPNLLLLDEPTNHLDLEMRHALDLALQQFSGAVILVTHDRHLLRDTVDEFWLVANARVRGFDGDLEEYREWLRRERAGDNAGGAPRQAGARAEAPRDKRSARQDAARRRARLRPMRDGLAKLERELESRRAELAEIEAALADSALYHDPDRRDEVDDLLRRQGRLSQRIDELETDWLERAEALEALENED
jgi:ATP-binding cassette subfamily F protein 3